MSRRLPQGRRWCVSAAAFLIALWPGGTSAGGGGDRDRRGSPYLEIVGRRDGLEVWVVDGMCVRTAIDVEFTNFGQHYRFPFIPEQELWVDRESAPDEQEFFIVHLIAERKMMAGGASYEQALDVADGIERERRNRDPGSRTASPHRSLWAELDGGVKVWVVDGRVVRTGLDIDFTEGGHDLVYDYVPAREVWIDNDLDESERPFVLYHELRERRLMAKGLDYESAHADASGRELRLRRRPEELRSALEEEGWSARIGFSPARECAVRETSGR